jgi:polyhydroxyalkanoate synthesis regulator phasin
MESLLLTLVLLCNFVQFFFWVKTFTLEKMKDFVTEILHYSGWKKLWEYVMLHDKAMYKTNEKIEELVTENKMLKSEVKTLKSAVDTLEPEVKTLKSAVKTLSKGNDDLLKRVVFIEQPETPLPKPSKGGKHRSC